MICKNCNSTMQLTGEDVTKQINNWNYHTCPKCHTGVSVSYHGKKPIVVWDAKAPREQLDELGS